MSKNQYHKLSQIEVDIILKKTSASMQELEAQRNLAAQNKAFDHFVNTGEVVGVEKPTYNTIIIDSLSSTPGGESIQYEPSIKLKLSKRK